MPWLQTCIDYLLKLLNTNRRYCWRSDFLCLFSPSYTNSEGLQKVHHWWHLLKSRQYFLREVALSTKLPPLAPQIAVPAPARSTLWTAALAPPPRARFPALPQQAAQARAPQRPQPFLTMPQISTSAARVPQASTPPVQQPPHWHHNKHPTSNRRTRNSQSNRMTSTSTGATGSSTSVNSATTSSTSRNHTGNSSRSKTKSPTATKCIGNNPTTNTHTGSASIRKCHTDVRTLTTRESSAVRTSQTRTAPPRTPPAPKPAVPLPPANTSPATAVPKAKAPTTKHREKVQQL